MASGSSEQLVVLEEFKRLRLAARQLKKKLGDRGLVAADIFLQMFLLMPPPRALACTSPGRASVVVMDKV